MSTLLVSSDNGFILQHTSPATDTVVYSGGTLGLGHAFESNNITVQPASYNNPQIVAAGVNFTSEPNAANSRIVSTDGGATWTEYFSDTTPAGYNGTHSVMAKDNTYNWNVDENGLAWISATQTGAPNHKHLFRSVDPEMSAWDDMFDATAAGFPDNSVYISDGYVWSLALDTLYRINTDGSGLLSWVITFPAGAGADVAAAGRYSINGWPRTKRLVGWRWASTGMFPTSNLTVPPILSIDLTDPANPTWVFSGDDPFGSFQAVYDAAPLSNQVLIANALNIDAGSPNRRLEGAIWRSTDGGSTWSNVVATTTNLGDAALFVNAELDNEVSAVAPNPLDATDAWVAPRPPYLYHSADSGASWSIETVDMTVFGPFLAGGVRPLEWTGICVTGVAAAQNTRVWGQVIGVFIGIIGAAAAAFRACTA